jgi:hypothetical protein
MIKIDPNEGKLLIMEATIEGIPPNEMSFIFKIILDENVEIGFPCKLNGKSIDINIPKLSTYIKNIKNGQYKAVLEATSKTHYLQPFADTILIEATPKIDLKLVEEIKLSEIKVSAIIEKEITKVENTKIEEEKSNVIKPDTKLRAFLGS